MRLLEKFVCVNIRWWYDCYLVISSLEEVKRTRAIHSNLLQTLARRAGGGLNGAAEIPEDFSFPLVTFTYVDDAEEKLKNSTTKCALVGQLFAVSSLAWLTDLYLLLHSLLDFWSIFATINKFQLNGPAVKILSMYSRFLVRLIAKL